MSFPAGEYTSGAKDWSIGRITKHPTDQNRFIVHIETPILNFQCFVTIFNGRIIEVSKQKGIFVYAPFWTDITKEINKRFEDR